MSATVTVTLAGSLFPPAFPATTMNVVVWATLPDTGLLVRPEANPLVQLYEVGRPPAAQLTAIVTVPPPTGRDGGTADAVHALGGATEFKFRKPTPPDPTTCTGTALLEKLRLPN